MRQMQALFAFNRGICSIFALARQDIKRIALSAETMTNFIAKVLGPMIFRPGTKYLATTGAYARMLKFIFATNDKAVVLLTPNSMQISINDTLLQRASVPTTVTNGSFSGNILGWTDGSDGGGSIAYEATNTLKLVSNGTARAIAYQAMTVGASWVALEHALRIVITRGPVTLRVGSALGADDYVSETSLDTGYHSIAFIPSNPCYIQFQSTTAYKKLISSCEIEAAGVVTVPTPWPSGAMSKIRYDQSADVLFVACDGYQQRKIERRGTRPNARSWSVCVYQSDDGPFKTENAGPITLSGSAITGDITVAASTALFKSTHVGALFSITSTGQSQTKTIAAQNTFTNSIRVTGVGAARSFGITLTGTLAASTVVLQSSLDNSSWNDVAGQSWGAVVSTAYADGLDNQIVYYRIGIKTGGYGGADSVACTLVFSAGYQKGVVRVTAFTNSTTVSAQVLFDLGSTSTTDIWQEGHWSDKNGWPTSVRLHEGRLWWFGRNGIWGSISDAYTSYNEDQAGNSGPINRTIGSGPVDSVNFALSLQRLVLGAEGKEISVRSSALDTPLTPTDFNMHDASTQGSAAVEAWKIDQRGVYVHRNTTKVYELAYDSQSFDYNSTDLTVLCPELCSPGVIRMDVQRQPDTRILCVRSDGKVVLSTHDKIEDVLAWQTLETNGEYQDVCVLPGDAGSLEDIVYYVVKRTIGGSASYYFEKQEVESNCRGATQSYNMDSYHAFSLGSPDTVVSGFPHLANEQVVVWADGAPLLDSTGEPLLFTVSSGGSITTDRNVTTGVVGLPYTGQWKSAKLALQGSAAESMLNQQKRTSHLGLLLAYFCPKALRFGPDFANMNDMPAIERGKVVTGTQVTYDEQTIPFPGAWVTDMRLCLEARSPMPVSVLAVVADLEVHS